MPPIGDEAEGVAVGAVLVDGFVLAKLRLADALGVGTAATLTLAVALGLGEGEASVTALNAGPAFFAGIVPISIAFVRTGTEDTQPAAINMRGTMPKRRMLVTPIGQTVLRHCTRA